MMPGLLLQLMVTIRLYRGTRGTGIDTRTHFIDEETEAQSRDVLTSIP